MKITKYVAAWNINNNEGRIKIMLEDKTEFQMLPVNNSSEFIAMLTILQGAGEAYINDNGWLGTREDESWS